MINAIIMKNLIYFVAMTIIGLIAKVACKKLSYNDEEG